MKIETDINSIDRDILENKFRHLFQRKFLKEWDREREKFDEELKWLSDAKYRVVEVGCGKGRFLINEALKHPDKKFLGFEIVNKRFQIAHRRARNRGLNNLLIVRRHAIPVISYNFPNNFIDEYFFLYPDPWPKRRHRRRRWYFHPFFLEVLRTTKYGGQITIATDNRNYINEAYYMFKNVYNLEVPTFREVPEDFKRTHFEEKFLKRGLKLYEIVGRKIIGGKK